MMRLLLIGCLLLLSACASQPPLPEKTPALALPMQLHVQRLADGQSQDWLLVIQREGSAIRWSMMDPLGIPLARQKLIDGTWQADGLLPPNWAEMAMPKSALAKKPGVSSNPPVARNLKSNVPREAIDNGA